MNDKDIKVKDLEGEELVKHALDLEEKLRKQETESQLKDAVNLRLEQELYSLRTEIDLLRKEVNLLRGPISTIESKPVKVIKSMKKNLSLTLMRKNLKKLGGKIRKLEVSYIRHYLNYTKKLGKDVLGSHDIFLTSIEGLPIFPSISKNVDIKVVSSMAGAIISVSERASEEHSCGILKKVLLEGDQGFIFFKKAGKNSIETSVIHVNIEDLD